MFLAAPSRIVSLKPNITDIVYVLGLGDKLVGITKYCEVPKGASRPEIIGDYTQAYVEKIVELSPEIVLGSKENSSRRSIESLRRMGVRVELFPFTTLARQENLLVKLERFWVCLKRGLKYPSSLTTNSPRSTKNGRRMKRQGRLLCGAQSLLWLQAWFVYG